MKYLVKFYRFLVKIESFIVPKSIQERTNPEMLGIREFMVFASSLVKSSDKVLDAGAGQCPYKKYFSHALYESTDIEDSLDETRKSIHTFICSLDDIPKANNSYNVIVNTQVLEHVEYPEKVIKEFYRILKPGGKLFLTAPQSAPIHEAPYNFYNFTSFGLTSLFKNAGFEIVFIKPRGGFFWCLGDLIRTFPSHIFFQYLFKKSKHHIEFKPRIEALLMLPFFIILQPICSFIIPLITFYLDRLDREKIFTLGYNCYCVK